MRKHVKVATLSLAVFAAACGTSKERSATLPEDLQKDLAAASAPASDLATAPKNFEPTRFVSEMERAVTATTVKKIVATKRHTKPVRRPQPVSKPAEELAAAEPVGTTAVAPAPTKTKTVDPATLPTIPEPTATAPAPGAEPATGPVATRGGSGDGGIGERRRGRGIGGLGGIFGGIIGAVVIRGGHGGVDKCDPRTDGRGGGIFIQGPNMGMPLPTGTFPRRFSRQYSPPQL